MENATKKTKSSTTTKNSTVEQNTTKAAKPEKQSLAYMLLVALGYDGNLANDGATINNALAEIRSMRDKEKIYHVTKCYGEPSPAWKAAAKLNADEQGKKWALQLPDGCFLVGEVNQ